jgi:uncharacterized protein YjbI with pentapeptide repeats
MSEEPLAEEPTPPKINAEDSAWYLLATLYGAQTSNVFENTDLSNKNRVAWNRYFAATLDDETRAILVKENRFLAEELDPLLPREVEGAFRRRTLGKNLELPSPDSMIDFRSVQFTQLINFSGYLFTCCSFAEAEFLQNIWFNRATFTDFGSFWRATFKSNAFFEHASFFAGVRLDEVIFERSTDFRNATFCGEADLSHAKFFREAYFSNATFDGASRFVNVQIKRETWFDGAKFKSEPPQFFGAELHPGTLWPGREAWPIPKSKDEAKKFVRAYERLKLEMDQLKKHEDELDFFALEMQSRRVLLGPWHGWPIWLYGLLSDFGRSYFRPLVALIVVAAVGAGAFWYSDARNIGEALGLSLANTLNVFGFRRDFNLSFDTPLAWLEVFAALQTIVGTVLLFLFGLGIRNKFRMK